MKIERIVLCKDIKGGNAKQEGEILKPQEKVGMRTNEDKWDRNDFRLEIRGKKKHPGASFEEQDGAWPVYHGGI